MKFISLKRGNRVTYRLVPDDYDENEKQIKPDTVTNDLTTSVRHTMSYCDIDKEDWDRIFKNDNGGNEHK